MRALECQKLVTLTTSLRSDIRSEKMPVTLSHLQLFQTRVIARADTREFPPGKSREFPENFQSRLVPGIFSISREISGNFYVL